MPTQLHILTRPADELVITLLERERAAGQAQIEVADLTQPAPDYGALVEKVFAADSVVTW
jgi:hypothetical protein